MFVCCAAFALGASLVGLLCDSSASDTFSLHPNPVALSMLDDCKPAVNCAQHGDGGLLTMQAMVQLLLHISAKHAA